MSPIRIRFTLDNGKTSYSEIEDYSDYVKRTHRLLPGIY